jgi:alpha-ketoglutarate-dependent taurine dioxygenase
MQKMSLFPPQDTASPFNLSSETAYQVWRNHKLDRADYDAETLLVDIADPYALSDDEKKRILDRCQMYNMALYRLSDKSVTDKSLVHAIGKQFGMVNLDANIRSDEDSVSSLEVREQVGNKYIPYTNHALSWHTDGYYNALNRQILGMVLHCVSPSDEGGVNGLLDFELAYIYLRDENPAYIEALMHPEAMTIPENIENGEVLRPAQKGPVFMFRPNGRVHMRYSARKRNIVWRDTDATRQAAERLVEIMASDTGIVRYRMNAGEGVITNNVLHNRTGFEDSDEHRRLMYRARYYDSVD